jgi:rubrerythrin
MEKDGKAFYLKASQASTNEMGQQLLKSLAAEEDIHIKVFTKIYEAVRNKQGWPEINFAADGGEKVKTIFEQAMGKINGQAKALTTELVAVQTAMSMENKSYDFYKSQSRQATHNAERDFYEALASQERGHHRVLLDYYEYLKDPAGWFVNKEHPSLDGG